MGATVAMVQVMVQAMVAMVATVATVVTVVAMVASMVATLAMMAMVTTVSNLPVPVSTGTGKKFPFNSQSQASLGLTRLYTLTMKSTFFAILLVATHPNRGPPLLSNVPTSSPRTLICKHNMIVIFMLESFVHLKYLSILNPLIC